jgi:hypothetical protein
MITKEYESLMISAFQGNIEQWEDGITVERLQLKHLVT